MSKFTVFREFRRNEDGNVAIEYGLIALFMGVALIASLELIPPELNQIFSDIAAFFLSI
ncbi:MAG: Flp family type IVb pilin [Hyphomicrobiaceae bacterium]|nr:Flp family type IVb pilin [Hyphomicrobiaceae bacterium]